MLSTLRIKNLALVEELSWELQPGLVGVTGETGAGKSIIVGALKLVLGERADRSLIRSGTNACTIEAVFGLPNEEVVNQLLEEAGLEPCEDSQLVIKRVISASGANKQFVNCSPSTLQMLKDLGHHLVDLHGPHEHQSLISQDRQLAMMDAFAQSETERAAYRKAYEQWRTLNRELEELSRSEQANEQEIDLLRHQIQEIGNAAPEPEEVATLEQRYQRASNRTRLLSLAGDILQRLEGGDQSILNQLRETQRLIRDLEQGDPQCSRWTGEFDSAQVELEELARSLNDYAGDLEINPKEHARLEERINTLETLKRKYGQTIEEILAFKEKAATRLAKIEGRDEAIEQLAGYVKKALRKGQSAGTKLTQKRRGAAPKLAKLICRHLKDLGFRQARIDIDLIPHDAPGSLGMETVDFIFAPNPGEPSKPLRVIASSGEMSRVMLAVKSALARQDAIPLLVFDEIDANVGGEIARAVGVKMAELGNAHQVIAITHLPQVAALAGSHFVVRKDFDDDRTRSTLTEVSTKDRVSEISRMLGGNEKSALAHARSLLKEAS